ncbi:MAG TPA: universal stress protein [Candidatus Limnocylindrales bacterium]|nr:universal stress protein [Candidatus Limnocylindrales bacterium]
MPSLSKILLPVDFSERSISAARYAKPIAAHFGSELILLHVHPLPQPALAPADFGGVMLDELYRDRGSRLTAELAAFLAEELAGLNVRRVVQEGDPASSIVKFAHAELADLIVMPTHGHGPFRRFILGSNTAKVLHDADCPVWTGVHLESPPSTPELPFRSIVCAVDLGSHSAQVLQWAAWLQSEFGAGLTVLHVAHAVPDSPDALNSDWRRHLEEAGREELEALQRAANVSSTRTLLEHGDPAHAICKAAKTYAADVVMIGRGSASGVFGRLRTNAYAIIRQSPCPVVSV